MARPLWQLVLADPSGVLGRAFGVVEGMIVDEPRGRHGFGYDPHFHVPEHGMTTAEMPPEQKNRISHRGKAFRAIRARAAIICPSFPELGALGGRCCIA